LKRFTSTMILRQTHGGAHLRRRDRDQKKERPLDEEGVPYASPKTEERRKKKIELKNTKVIKKKKNKKTRTSTN